MGVILQVALRTHPADCPYKYIPNTWKRQQEESSGITAYSLSLGAKTEGQWCDSRYVFICNFSRQPEE